MQESVVVSEAEAGARGPASLPVVYGLIHALIDAACVAVVYKTIPWHSIGVEHAMMIVLGYDLLAFASQWIFGLAADKHRAARTVLLGGIGLTAVAVAALPWQPWMTMLFAGLGNAMFHVGAGAIVLCQSPRRAAPSGIFVAPGALGLALGIWMGRDGGSELMWPFLPLLVIAFGVVLALRTGDVPDTLELPGGGNWLANPPSRPTLLVMLLLVSIFVRSFVGFGGCHDCPREMAIKLGIPLVAFLGKGVGGIVADRFGWLETAVFALLLSAPMIAFGSAEPVVILTGLFLFQMTMPVTLAAAAMAMPRRVGTAFGLTCLALILGALPTFSPLGQSLYSPPAFVALIVISALSVSAGLYMLGEPLGGSRLLFTWFGKISGMHDEEVRLGGVAQGVSAHEISGESSTGDLPRRG